MGIVEEARNLKSLGTGEKMVILAHAFGTNQSVWRHLVPHLVNGFRVVLYDNMGAGTTNPDYYDFDWYSTLEGYALDLLAILVELEVDSCIFLGHSLSVMTGEFASIIRLDLFDKLIMITPSPRFLMNDADYCGGFKQEDIDQLLQAVQSNYKTWCSGFASLLVGGDMASPAVQEFSRTLFNMRPDIVLNVVKTIFQYDFRLLLRYMIIVPSHIIRSQKDMAVPVQVSEYIHCHLGGKSIVEIMSVEGHLPQLTSPEIVIPVLLRHIQCDLID